MIYDQPHKYIYITKYKIRIAHPNLLLLNLNTFLLIFPGVCIIIKTLNTGILHLLA